MAGTPSAPGAILVTTLTGQELVEIIGSGPQKEVTTIASIVQSANDAALYSYTTNAATTSTLLTAAQIDGGGVGATTLALTGTLGGAANAQLPTVAALVASDPAFTTGATYLVRIINPAGSQTWTVTTNTGWTLSGAMTIPTATWRDFYIIFTSPTAATLQTVGTGTAP